MNSIPGYYIPTNGVADYIELEQYCLPSPAMRENFRLMRVTFKKKTGYSPKRDAANWKKWEASIALAGFICALAVIATIFVGTAAIFAKEWPMKVTLLLWTAGSVIVGSTAYFGRNMLKSSAPDETGRPSFRFIQILEYVAHELHTPLYDLCAKEPHLLQKMAQQYVGSDLPEAVRLNFSQKCKLVGILPEEVIVHSRADKPIIVVRTFRPPALARARR